MSDRMQIIKDLTALLIRLHEVWLLSKPGSSCGMVARDMDWTKRRLKQLIDEARE